MIPLAIGFDMDGTLADLGSACAEVENRLFGTAEPRERPAPEAREAEQHDEEEKPRPERQTRLRRRTVGWSSMGTRCRA